MPSAFDKPQSDSRRRLPAQIKTPSASIPSHAVQDLPGLGVHTPRRTYGRIHVRTTVSGLASLRPPPLIDVRRAPAFAESTGLITGALCLEMEGQRPSTSRVKTHTSRVFQYHIRRLECKKIHFHHAFHPLWRVATLVVIFVNKRRGSGL